MCCRVTTAVVNSSPPTCGVEIPAPELTLLGTVWTTVCPAECHAAVRQTAAEIRKYSLISLSGKERHETVDLGFLRNVLAIGTQGAISKETKRAYFVRSYKVDVSSNGEDWMPHTLTRYVRIRPLSWETGISMRFEVYGCKITAHLGNMTTVPVTTATATATTFSIAAVPAPAPTLPVAKAAIGGREEEVPSAAPTLPVAQAALASPADESALLRTKLALEIEVLQRQARVLQLQEEYFSLQIKRLKGDAVI
ncbi:hypothetical protein JZ751_000022 [Albula glossodonta]|uniref:F5/8 type C domain-containing protein n=1 Tax=Albula glossodonta TaxID=121402 RepID=A0A8T2PV46_9TELE|nr:hypothetical protein JZ751_000022 [Albula glossodonta]